MRELMPQIVNEGLPEFRPEGETLVLLQSRAYQRDMYEYFEGVLDATLAENIRLLHGILPEEVANELKRKGHVTPTYIPDAAIIFTDFEHFSVAAERLTTYGMEKIKTIGDSYMAGAGSTAFHDRAPKQYLWEARGVQSVKGLGAAEMYFLIGKTSPEQPTS